MSVIGVASMKNSPGVTTFALALATTWPGGDTVFVELDASGGELGGYFHLDRNIGIASLATELRRERDPDVLFHHTQTLPGGQEVIAAPVGPAQAHAAVTALTTTLPEVLRKSLGGTTLVADLGRLAGPSAELAASMDTVLVMARPRLTDLMHLEGLAEAVPHAEIILTGPGTYPPGEVIDALGVKVRAHIAHDPAAQWFIQGRHGRTRFVRAVRRVAAGLAKTTRREGAA
ncbi:hypothetical protein [Planobispora takensis]|uniref:Uncharacterized protein n=1 Tax=Planobispora takensis TaxID=1367882 RepID=A0A8J3WSF3_9ACTN|nr:hypothetical protein [Planobispora takensis]GIH99197.1 hypothetical protein Pta02_12060 [Planobispora takensis]